MPSHPTVSFGELRNLVIDDFQVQRLQADGPVAEAFNGKAAEAMLHPEDAVAFTAAADRTIAAMPGQTARYITEHIARNVIAQEVRYTAETGEVPFTDLAASFDRLGEDNVRFAFDLNLNNPIQSSISERGKAFHFALRALGIVDNVVLLDLGSGGEQVSRQLVLNLPYKPTEVVERRKSGSRNTMQKSTPLSRSFEAVLRKPVSIQKVVGLDLMNPRDPAVMSWIDACSFYFDERLDPQTRERFDALQTRQLDEIEWKFEDFTAYSPDAYRRDFPGQPLPNAMIASFSIYQTSRSEARQTVGNMRQFANEGGGVALILDDITAISPNDEPKVVVRRPDYTTTGLWAYDGRRPQDGWQKLLSTKNGRVAGVHYEPALGHVLLQSVLDGR